MQLATTAPMPDPMLFQKKPADVLDRNSALCELL
jgi:hypothetical protein